MLNFEDLQQFKVKSPDLITELHGDCEVFLIGVDSSSNIRELCTRYYIVKIKNIIKFYSIVIYKNGQHILIRELYNTVPKKFMKKFIETPSPTS